MAAIELVERIGKKTPEEQLRIRAEAEYIYTYCYHLDEDAWVKRKIADFAQVRQTYRAIFDYVGDGTKPGHHDKVKLAKELANISDPLTETKWENIDEFIELSLAERSKWYIDDRLPVGQFVTLCGHEKAGKTVLAYHLLSCLLTGKDWLGLPVKPCSVVILNWENPSQYAAQSLVNCMPVTEWRKARDEGRVRWVRSPNLPHTLTVSYLHAISKGMTPGVIAVDTIMAALAPCSPLRTAGVTRRRLSPRGSNRS